MLEMASLGAKVMQPSAVQTAMANNIPVHVRSTFSKEIGTKIVSEEEIDTFRVQLSDILSHFDALQKIDTESIEPSFHPVSFDIVMRNDELADSLALEEVLKNAPRTEGDLFRIRAVLE